MANTTFLGRAGAVADKMKVTIAGTWGTGDTLTVWINGKGLVVTIGSLTTTAQVATTLKQAWENETLTDTTASYTPADGSSDLVEHGNLTATVSGSEVTLTGDVEGEPWLVADFGSPEVTNGTAQSGTSSTIVIAAGESAVDDYHNGQIIRLTDNTGGGQWRFISDYTGASKTVTVTPDWDVNPDNTTEYSIRNAGVRVSESTTGNGTATLSHLAVATGPNHADNADNWSAGEVPGTSASTEVWIENTNIPIKYGAFSTANALTSFNVALTQTGEIGLPKQSDGGYEEFRLDYLVVNSPIVRLYGQGTGTGRVKIDSEANQVALTIEGTGAAAEVGLGAFIWRGTNAANTLRVSGGSVSVAPFGGEAAGLASAVIANASVTFSDGVTWAGGNTVDITGSTVECRTDLATVTQHGGVVTLLGSAAVSTLLDIRGGVCVSKSSGTVASLKVGGPTGANFDASQDNVAKAVTALERRGGGTVTDPLQTITYGSITLHESVEVVTAA